MSVQFHSPGGIAKIDYGSDTAGYQAFIEAWTANMSRWSAQSVLGDPWSNDNDDQRDWYINPAVSGWPTSAPVPITWTAFPNRLTMFYTDAPGGNPDPTKNPTVQRYLTDDEVLALADAGQITVDGTVWKLHGTSSADKILQIPAHLCDSGNCQAGVQWNGPYADFAPGGPRGWLDEYCEWAIERNADGSMKRIEFTCENPDYWFTLWSLDPNLVVELYQQHVNPAVTLADLSYVGADGKPLIDPLTGRAAYNPINKWNSGTEIHPDSGGAMHLTSPPNTIGAEIYLAAAGTIARDQQCSAAMASLICCSLYGQPFRNSDPHIGFSANQAANPPGGNGKMLTLADPVGLYMQLPTNDFAAFEFPDGTTATDWYQITRGSTGTPADMILHVRFEAPAGHAMSEVMVTDPNGQAAPLTHAGQIAQSFKMALNVVVQSPPPGTSDQPPRPCVTTKSDAEVQPWPAQLLPKALLDAGSPSALAAEVRPGSTYQQMALVVIGGKSGASITFDHPGVTATITSFEQLSGGGAPGQTATSSEAYVFDLQVAADVPAGDIGIKVCNPNGDPSTFPFAVGLLAVV